MTRGVAVHMVHGDVPDSQDDLLAEIVDALPAAIAVLRGPDFILEHANRAFDDLVGGAARPGRPLADEWPELAGRLDPLLERVAAGGAPVRLEDVALDLARPRPGAPEGGGDPARTFTLTLERLALRHRIPAVLLTAVETTELLRARRELERVLATEQAARNRLAHGQQLTAALASARTVPEVAEAVFRNGLAAFGAQAGWIALPDGTGHLTAGASFGYEEERLRPWRRFPLSADVPIAEAVRTGTAIFVESLAELKRRYPELARVSRGRTVCLAALPLTIEGQATGGLALTFEGERTFSEEDRAYVGWLARKCAQALERARAHEAERAARTQAVEIGRLQEHLMAVVGHDLRSPLTAVTTTAALLLRRGGLDEKQVHAVERIASGAARMGSIIRDLLDLSVARSGHGIPIRREPADLGEVARRAIQEAEAGGAEGRLALVVEGDTRLRADPARLSQVVANLVGNALDHGAGSPVRVEVAGLAGEVALRVHNGGPAIAAELLPEIFEPFRHGEPRAHPAGGRGASIGLGLFIVRELVRAHGGAVEVRTGEGGTTFEVRLPRGEPGRPGG